MTKLEFMKELESLLSDIALEEREEALAYYNGYFEDAGEDHEEEVIKELGSPQKVAAIIKADLAANAADLENRGYYTEKGYQDTVFKDEKYEIVGSGKKGAQSGHDSGSNNTSNAYGTNQTGNTNNTSGTNGSNNNAGYGQGQNNNPGMNQAQHAQQYNRNTNIGLAVVIGILAFCTFPFWFSIIATIFGLIIGFGAAGVAMIIGGIALFIAGLMQLAIPVMALLFCGGGLLVFGLGMLFTLLCVVLCKNVLPAVVKGIVNLCRQPFKNRSVMA